MKNVYNKYIKTKAFSHSAFIDLNVGRSVSAVLAKVLLIKKSFLIIIGI